jgi:hypothetical protein
MLKAELHSIGPPNNGQLVSRKMTLECHGEVRTTVRKNTAPS